MTVGPNVTLCVLFLRGGPIWQLLSYAVQVLPGRGGGVWTWTLRGVCSGPPQWHPTGVCVYCQSVPLGGQTSRVVCVGGDGIVEMFPDTSLWRGAELLKLFPTRQHRRRGTPILIDSGRGHNLTPSLHIKGLEEESKRGGRPLVWHNQIILVPNSISCRKGKLQSQELYGSFFPLRLIELRP